MGTNGLSPAAIADVAEVTAEQPGNHGVSFASALEMERPDVVGSRWPRAAAQGSEAELARQTRARAALVGGTLAEIDRLLEGLRPIVEALAAAGAGLANEDVIASPLLSGSASPFDTLPDVGDVGAPSLELLVDTGPEVSSEQTPEELAGEADTEPQGAGDESEHPQSTVRLSVVFARRAVRRALEFVHAVSETPQLRFLRLNGADGMGLDLWVELREQLDVPELVKSVEGVASVEVLPPTGPHGTDRHLRVYIDDEPVSRAA